MTDEQKRELNEKLNRLGYATYTVKPGLENVLMLYVEGHLICGALYALEMPESQLRTLLAETVVVR